MPFKIIHAWFSFDFDQMICLNSSHIYTSPTTVDATQYVCNRYNCMGKAHRLVVWYFLYPEGGLQMIFFHWCQIVGDRVFWSSTTTNESEWLTAKVRWNKKITMYSDFHAANNIVVSEIIQSNHRQILTS